MLVNYIKKLFQSAGRLFYIKDKPNETSPPSLVPEGLTFGFIFNRDKIKPYVFINDLEAGNIMIFEVLKDMADCQLGISLYKHLEILAQSDHPSKDVINSALQQFHEYLEEEEDEEEDDKSPVVDPRAVFGE